jgi:glycosyltransferase involved in cell wall biosynthesis
MGAWAARYARDYTWSTTAARLRRLYTDLTERSLVDCAA